MLNKQRYDAIDLAKLIASILIVALHSDLLYDVYPAAHSILCSGLARLAVPFFFTTSAFFFFCKQITAVTTKRYCLRLLKLYLCWFIIYLPKTIFDRIVCSDYPLPETMLRFLRSFFVTSTFSGSWFLVSCIFCGLLFFALEKLPDRVRRTLTILLATLVYGLCVFASGYGMLVKRFGLSHPLKIYTILFANPYNNLFVGIPYFALGRAFANGKLPKKQLAIPGLIVSLLLLFAEVLIIKELRLTKATDCYLMLLPCMFFMFPLLLDANLSLRYAPTYRSLSTIIFFSHFGWLFFTELLEWLLKCTIPITVKFMIALGGSLLTALVILKLQTKKRFHWLRYFY